MGNKTLLWSDPHKVENILRNLIILFLLFGCHVFSPAQIVQETDWLSPTVIDNSNNVDNSGNIFTSDDQCATFDGNNDRLTCSGFSLPKAIPFDATIVGIEVSIEGYRTNNNNRVLNVYLSWNGNNVMNDNPGTANFTAAKLATFASNEAYITLGGNTDTWGHNWTYTELSNGNFRVGLDATGNGVYVDHIRVKIYYTSPSALYFTESGTITIPNYVTKILVECWGGGGNGGNGGYGILTNTIGGGGGGGAYAASTLDVTPGTSYSYHVGGTGGSSWFGSTTTINAGGGSDGSNNGAGNGGTATHGDTEANGANGANGGTGGNAGGTGGGTGGAARTDRGVGNAGGAPGGGGGGGYGNNNAGGAGAKGAVRITYICPNIILACPSDITKTEYLCGLKNLYRFNGNVDDAIGSQNGTANNGPTYDDAAINLDGTNDYVKLPDDIVNGLNDITIATWVYWDGGGNWQRIFDFGSGTGIYMFLTPKTNDGKMRFAITLTNNAGEQQITANNALGTGAWHHVAVTLSGNLGIMYLDGTEVARNNGITINPSNMGNTLNNYIGESQYNNDPSFNGKIRDFRIYDRALSAAEIQQSVALFTTIAEPTVSGGCGPITITHSPKIMHLGSQTVTWTATDMNGYTATCNQNITVNNVENDRTSFDDLYLDITDATCSGSSNGVAEVKSSNNDLSGLKFFWDGSTVPGGSSKSGLSAATHNVRIESCGISKTLTFQVLDAISSAYVVTEPVSSPCDQSSNGKAFVKSLNGLNNFSYSWTNGTGQIATTDSITNLPIGNYTVVITDNNCGPSTTKTIDFYLGYEYSECASGTVTSGSISSSPTLYDSGSASSSVITGSSNMEIDADFSIAAGDLLLIIQMQGISSINMSNSSSYGSYNENNVQAGYYEYAVVKDVINRGTKNQVITLTDLRNTYYNSEAESDQTAMRYQIVKVARYNDLTLTGNITAQPWNGKTGGVLAIDVAGTLNLNGKTISADGAGFRGGAGFNWLGTANDRTSDVPCAVSNENSPYAYKGEGIGGTPAKVYANGSVVQTGTDYYNGGKARGAVGNAGGGGNDGLMDNTENSGGGGGANRAAGGKGGNTWNSNLATGGAGGNPFTQATTARIIMGGGGGAGTANNATAQDLPHGGSGGGIIIIHANSIVGNGTISANGTNGTTTTHGDGAGGGGAGGTILVTALNGMSTITAYANGGNGGSVNNNDKHGPGGGGSGGTIYGIDDMAENSSANNGIGGYGSSSNNDNYGSISGTIGSSEIVDEEDYQGITVVGRNCGMPDTEAPIVDAPDLVYCSGTGKPTEYTKISQLTEDGGSVIETVSGLACIKKISETVNGMITTRVYRVYDRAGNYAEFTQTITEITNSVTPALRLGN